MFFSFSPKLSQFAAHIWIFYAQWAIEIPRECCTTRASTWFVIRHIIWCFRVISSLIFPRYNTILNVDIPATRTSTVYAMRCADNFIVRPTVTIKIFPLATAIFSYLMAAWRYVLLAKKLKLLRQQAHLVSSFKTTKKSLVLAELTQGRKYCYSILLILGSILSTSKSSNPIKASKSQITRWCLS